jgi:hypothetical protein
MKFNWGTGIFIFLGLFLLASAAFIIFAVRQDVNLVHKDYYEKGVDYTEQMNVNSRSAEFKNAFSATVHSDFLKIDIEEKLAVQIDSGTVLLFRPSNSKNDISVSVVKSANVVLIPKKDLLQGRYIMKFSWYSGGIKYEIDQPVNIQ